MALRGRAIDRPAFGAGPAFTVGAEEELLLVDVRSGELSGSGYRPSSAKIGRPAEPCPRYASR
jgi:hypothetical protein